MSVTHLTDIVVSRIKSPGTYFDETTPAFGIRVGKNRRTWIVMRGVQRQRVRVGHYPAMSLADARKEAKKLLTEEPTKNSSMTFGAASDLYKVAIKAKKPRTQRDYYGTFETSRNVHSSVAIRGKADIHTRARRSRLGAAK
jgi:hypothetical protein